MTALPPELTIDDLTFVDLLKIALDDLPGASAGAWTMHGPLDPGITLLELFAWRLEQRLFAAEQVTEPVVRSGLRLLGLGDLAPGRAARTVVSLRGGGPARTLTAGSVLQLQDDDMGRRFTTEHDVDVLPVHGVETLGAPRVPGDVLDLRLDREGPIVGDATLTLLLLLPSRGAARPSWEVSTDVEEQAVPPPVDLEWTATGPDGSSRAVPVQDGTGGLRRSGLLQVPWPVGVGPGGWARLPAARHRARRVPDRARAGPGGASERCRRPAPRARGRRRLGPGRPADGAARAAAAGAAGGRDAA